jgi:hypothetical protein
MKKPRIVDLLPALLALAAFIVLSVYPASAADKKVLPFLDYDGDGFNDNIPDSDGDGIPDNADSDWVESLAPNPEAENIEENIINFGEGLQKLGLISEPLTNSAKFGRVKFCARTLSQSRCNLDIGEGFGPSAEIGIGAGSGSGCAGGVCR